MTQFKIVRNSQYYSVHTHSRYSYNDALPSVQKIVAKASSLGYPALALTDHGNMAGSVQLYKECKKQGIKPMPGTEIYLVKDRSDKRAKRYHAGLIAYTTKGYRNLVHASTLSHANFHHKPLLDLGDLSTLASEGRTEGLAFTTGCYGGMVIQTLISEGYCAAKRLVATLAKWFDVYVEIQIHNHDYSERINEKNIALLMERIADELGLPIVIAQDSHYTDEKDREAHDTLKALVSWSPDPDDAQFSGDGFQMVDDRWMKDHHHPRHYEKGIAGLRRLLDRYDMYIPEMEEYSFKVPRISKDPDTELHDRCIEGMRKHGLNLKRYVNLLQEELDVISTAGMADYMLMVANVCNHMREVGMFYQIRGSAAGSLVCLLTGVSDLDPIRWKLRFDRFLSKDRTKPPDIDIDIEHDRRGELMEWIAEHFSVVQIGTWGTYSLGGPDDPDRKKRDKGSLKVKYLSMLRKLSPNGDIGEAPWRDAPQSDKDLLLHLSSLNLLSGPGTHAAGLVVASSQMEIDRYCPLQWIASSKTWVTQYDMKDIEEIGMVKLDVLGVKTLTVLRETILNLGKDPKDGLDWIEFTSPGTYKMIANGDTDGVFQLEGWTSQREVRTLAPTKIGDVIAAMALFRPGVMKSGAAASYMRRKNKEERLPVRHPIIAKATNETFGILLYQDQVIEILRDMGMDADNLTAFLKAVKASNKGVTQARKTMEHYEPIVQRMCVDHGMDDGDVQWLWNALEAFAEYSFNRAHATVYGITAYRCAWLIKHHPLEFHAALLAVAAGTDKEDDYKKVTRRRKIKLLRPDVNTSRATYSVDSKTQSVRRGLLSIDGIGPAAAQEIERHQPFTDLDDLCSRVSPRKISGAHAWLEDRVMTVGKIEVLYKNGALGSLVGE